ncbi:MULTISPECIES: hypothetical protein [unclassified Sphingopyxis]|uniref:hypothetical protein n=1 Tax=unclassified Sphingopyxis TaxID=2614943 RepID=UPI0007379C40|nr:MULTISPECIES: hypothetical protein [unclassified Sphingopyxis]KTE33266.1 hypothetical protein ATE62_17235 [Sphingopyxis sp. HIX]KTE81081.1 hypothetical protein ATE72_17130 [Sphingopyxis sp. HXXIV]
MRAVALLGLVLLFTAGCSERSDPAETGKDGWRIPAGVYGNVAPDAENGRLRGMEVSLDRGDESATADFARCEGRCEAAAKRPLRRGLNGVSFAIEHEGRTIDVLVGPAGPDAVEVSADWGRGLESHRLPKIVREVGLAAARQAAEDAAAPDAPAPPMPVAPSSPPPLPSPTP